MRIALWPVTWGYMLDQLAGELSDDAIAAARAHFLASVAAGGALPTAAARPPAVRRAGGHVARGSGGCSIPPTSTPSSSPLLHALAPAWRAALRAVPRVAPGVDLGAVLATAVAMGPVSLHYAARGLSLPAPRRRHVRAPRAGAADRSARSGCRSTRRSPGPCSSRSSRRSPARWSPTQPSETAPLPAAQNYINWLVRQRPRHGAHRRSPGRREHAAVRAAAPRAAARLRDRRAAHRPRPRARRAGRGHRARPGRRHAAPSPWARLAAPLDGVTAAGQTLGQHLDAVRAANSAAGSPAAAQLTEFLELHGALRQLIVGADRGAGAARRRRARPRLAPPRRLGQRAGHAPARHAAHPASPLGVRLGGYGVLEDVRPATAAQAASHGYIHAPSLGQAATAAVLRSGHLAHVGGPDAAARARPLLAARAARARPARRRPRRPAARRAARLPPGARPAREPSRARPGPLHRGAAGARSAGRDHRRRARPAASRPTGSTRPRQVLGQLRQQSDAAKAADTALRAQIAAAQPAARRGAGERRHAQLAPAVGAGRPAVPATNTGPAASRRS